jgi:dihydrofolate reductase
MTAGHLSRVTNDNSSWRPTVRKIKSSFFVSLDGVVESPDKWHFPYFDDEMGAAVGAGFATTDALLMGRVLYEEWAAYWPEHADEPFGDVMNGMKKYVVSDSLQAATWQNSEIISGDVARKVADIKAGDGGDISMSGSATTVRWLLRHGLLDELNLLVHPIVVGDGMARLFPADEPGIPLELRSAQTFKTGVLNLSYAPATS